MTNEEIQAAKTTARLRELRGVYHDAGGVPELAEEASQKYLVAKEQDPSLTMKTWLLEHPEYRPEPATKLTIEELRQAQLDRPNSMYKSF